MKKLLLTVATIGLLAAPLAFASNSGGRGADGLCGSNSVIKPDKYCGE